VDVGVEVRDQLVERFVKIGLRKRLSALFGKLRGPFEVYMTVIVDPGFAILDQQYKLRQSIARRRK
jgi:hypothetical protein